MPAVITAHCQQAPSGATGSGARHPHIRACDQLAAIRLAELAGSSGSLRLFRQMRPRRDVRLAGLPVGHIYTSLGLLPACDMHRVGPNLNSPESSTTVHSGSEPYSPQPRDTNQPTLASIDAHTDRGYTGVHPRPRPPEGSLSIPGLLATVLRTTSASPPTVSVMMGPVSRVCGSTELSEYQGAGGMPSSN